MDLIERQAAIDAFTNATSDGDKVEFCWSVIRSVPPAQPERKRGKWLPENRTMDAFWVCSACGFPSEAHAANIIYNFCPNCGADMRGEE